MLPLYGCSVPKITHLFSTTIHQYQLYIQWDNLIKFLVSVIPGQSGNNLWSSIACLGVRLDKEEVSGSEECVRLASRWTGSLIISNLLNLSGDLDFFHYH